MTRRGTGAASAAALLWLAVIPGIDARAGAAALQDRGAAPVELTRLPGPIQLDGHPDEPIWQQVPALPLTMYFPVFRGQPAQRSEIRVAYDDEYLYAAGWFWDDEPQGIRINSLYRDRWNGDDAFAVYVDVFNDNQSAKWFGTTPAAMRFDLLVSGDGTVLNDSWDGVWEARTTVTAQGWFAEVRIPFSTLGFQTTDGTAVMGLMVTRLVSRTGERVTFPDIDPRYDFRQPSRAQDVVLHGVTSGLPLYVTPYLLGGSNGHSQLDAAAGRWRKDFEPQREVGLDLRYALSPNLTVDATLNTDFAQVEADDQQVNLTRFSLFFPEKRRFFQERSAIFDFPTGGDGRLFHSRRIGLSAEQLPLPVQGGGRLVGRLGEWDLGALGMRTDNSGTLAEENFGVLRLRRRVLDSYSTVGVMLTARTGANPDNFAAGIDGEFHLFGENYLSTVVAATHDEAEPAATRFADRSTVHLQWERRTNRGLWYNAAFTRAGGRYHPALGFLPRRDFTAFTTATNYFIFADADSWLRRIFPGGVVEGTYRNGAGVLESGRIAGWVEIETKAGAVGWVEPQLFREDVREAFDIAGAVQVPAGGYTFANLWLFWQMPSGRRMRTGADLQVGSFYDGFRTQLMLTPTWNVSSHLELGGQYIGNFLRFAQRDQSANIHLARVRVRTALNARASGNAFVQYNSTTDRLEMNLRLRYNFAEGTDLWLVYNEGLATERDLDPATPRLPFSMARALVVKYTKTFAF